MSLPVYSHHQSLSNQIEFKMKSSTMKSISFLIIISIYLRHLGNCQEVVNITSNQSDSNNASSTTHTIEALKFNPLTSTNATNIEGHHHRQPSETISSIDETLSPSQQATRQNYSVISDRAPSSPTENTNLTESLQTLTPTTSGAKSAPVLRPSIEEVASELSKKYLNLEHENRRHKQHPHRPAELNKNSTTAVHLAESDSSPLPIEAEHDIHQPVSPSPHDHPADAASAAASNRSSTQFHAWSGGLFDDDHHYLRIDDTSSRVVAQNVSRKLNRAHHQPKRKTAGEARSRSAQLQASEDFELQQCQQYLQIHGPSSSSGPSDMDRLNNPNMPCFCEPRKHFAFDNDGTSLVQPVGFIWLNCDNIQLIGNQLYNPNYDNNSNNFNNFSSFSSGRSTNKLNNQGFYLTQFSQRDAGLQTILSQKFHYLQLYHLRSIDLSNNRLRNIKLDAFHGLENSLEYLNLANNLLGDSRASFAGNGGGRPANLASSPTGSMDSTPNNSQNNIGKLIFYSDELNRLKKLTWLSLSNNQINQLSPSVFVKNSATIISNNNNIHLKPGQQIISATSVEDTPNGQPNGHQKHETIYSELVQLDLSDNLLKFVPSDSIRLLNKLKILKLNRNRIIQLDQLSKFPHTLEYLDLSENLISSIRHCDLIDLPNLIELNLSHNQLRHLDQTAFISATLSHQANINPTSSLLPATGDRSPINQIQEQLESSSLVERKPTSELVGGSDPVSLKSSADDGNGRRSFIPNQDDNINDRNDIKSNELLKRRRRRRRRSTSQLFNSDVELEMEESSPGHIVQAEGADQEASTLDLDSEESILTTVRQRFRSAHSISDELNTARQPPNQFNSTLRLNLTYNFLENIPGDTLVKFSNLQSLDLSFNRIRTLDSNYLCSIYNLVDNLRLLDLSGNLLSLNGDIANQRQLNKLFGCLQRLEKLLLSTNRLGVHEGLSIQRDSSSPSKGADFIQILDDDSRQQTNNNQDSPTNNQPDANTNRLSIKLGDSFGGKYMNTLDLSDNQLRHMPFIDQVTQQLTVSGQNNNNSGMAAAAPNQTQLNQWISSRIYLEVLNLNYNHIERLEKQDFDDLYNLRQLHLDFNKLTTLPVKLMRRFTSLDKLSVAGNKLSSVDPLNELIERSVRTLRTLNLANNRLMEWPAMTKQLIATSSDTTNYNSQQHLESMSTRHFTGGEQFISLGAAGEPKARQMLLEFALEDLNLEGNRFTSVNVTSLFDQLVHMRSLKRLNLSFNLLNKIKSEWFKFANKNLQRLLLTGNKINNIDLGAFAMNQVNELISLDLDYNLLKELRRKTFDSMPKLREINLAHNLIHTINSETFHQMNSLQVLKLNNNKLTSWKCEYFAHLCNSISGQINVDLATLLSSMPTTTTTTTTTNSGDLMNNQPAAGTSQPPPVSALIELDLSHNSLSQLRANSISVHTKLVRLDLSHNKLSFIPHDLFKATATFTSSSNSRQVHLVSSLKYLNLAFNRIQTIDNINFRPLRNLISLDLSHNELQTLGVDVVLMDLKNAQHREQSSHRRNIIISNNLTNLLVDEHQEHSANNNRSGRSAPAATTTTGPVTSWPGLCKLRHLNLAHNQLTLVNQSILSELSPFVSLNLNLSSNFLDSESLPQGFYTKISNTQTSKGPTNDNNYDLVYTLKLESLDLSYNRLSEYPNQLLDNHYSSMETCNLSHNRIQQLPQNSNSMIQIKSLNFEFNPLSRESNELILFEQKSVRYLNLAATRLYAIQQAISENIPTLGGSHAQAKHRLANQTSQLDLIRSISKPIDAPYLRHLNLSSNQLVWLSANIFDKMHSLQTLDLSNNQLTRLHLLNNQLSHVATTLEYLYMGSNLFTNIDATDFSQLITIKHLDLSNLLSLQKLNCKFLAKLTTLRVLRMFNYPQLRHSLANLLIAFNSHKSSSNDRFRRKIQEELVASTIGKHCFQETKLLHGGGGGGEMSSDQSTTTTKWFNLDELELELYNDFSNLEQDSTTIGGYYLKQELRQLLGPKLHKISLIGLNVTSISDDSLLGVTSDDLSLKISYTSIAQLPLRQIMSSLAKRTKLDLDLRNNNIQSIDMESMQWLDELQANAQAISSAQQYPALKLASNPFRCDCQTRPLWLWLNQRWENIEVPHISDEQIGGESAIGNSANYYLKFHPYISQTSDLKCFYPLKLRGKLVQHVNYNELVCKGGSSSGLVVAGSASGPSPPSVASPPSSRQAKRRNDTSSATRLADSYYLTSLINGDYLADSMDDLDDEDYLDASESSRNLEAFVKVTRFNRYPSMISNSSSLYFLNNFPIINQFSHTQERSREAASFGPDSHDGLDETIQPNPSSRMGKRDHNSAPSVDQFGVQQVDQQQHQVNTRYNKHRPNSHQKHSHFDTLSNLNQLHHLGRSLHSKGGVVSHSSSGPSGKQHSVLTESDIMIITVASIAMTVMSFVIMGICVFKYRMDHSDREQIITNQGRALLAAAAAAQQPHLFVTKANLIPSKSRTNKGSSSMDSSSDDNSKKSSSTSNSQENNKRTNQQNGRYNHQLRSSSGKSRHHKLRGHAAIQTANGQIFLPVKASFPPSDKTAFMAPPVGQNFLMRSPTIRRMHGIATNASDWFKYTLKVHPSQVLGGASSSGSRRRRLFVRNNAVGVQPSQLTTAKLANRFNQHHVIVIDSSSVLPDQRQGHFAASQSAGATNKQSDGSSSSTASSSSSSSSSPPKNKATSSSTVNGSKETVVEKQKAPSSSLQAAIDHQNGGYMPPNMIKALARQLDERHQANRGDECMSVQQSQVVGRVGSGYYTREQQVKSMRTFGRDINASGGGGGGKAQPVKSNDDNDRPGIPSQLPTIDVDGRFTYQSESQIESPSVTAYTTQNSSQVNTRGRNTPTSTVATGQEDIFILVRDTPSQSSFATKSQTSARYPLEMSSSAAATTITTTTTTTATTSSSSSPNQRHHRHIAELSSMTNEEDECSRTSSPVAYGFMRSSPSATTLSSSVTNNIGQYALVSKKPLEAYHHANYSSHLRQPSGGADAEQPSLFYDKSRGSFTEDNNNNNNNYIMNNNNNNLATCDPNATMHDDQIIISRL